MASRKDALKILLTTPSKFANKVGFELLGDLHNRWIIDMVSGKGDRTLRAHRGSYKTTCVSVAFAVIMICFPELKILFMRKTDTDVKEILRQTAKILKHPITQYLCECIWGVQLVFTTENAMELNTNLTESDTKGTSQLVGLGLGSSITGKHFDRIFTDDIVNLEDRRSKSEREKTKLIYQELQNVKNRGGRIYNTGTPWHPEDCFTIMPNIIDFDCYSTGLISEQELDAIREKMLPSLFAANYELRHIASEDVIFTNPVTGADPSNVDQARWVHIDAAYGGEDYTAFTIAKKTKDKIYVFGKLWHKHVEDVQEQIIAYRREFNAGAIRCETNADKGYLSKQLRQLGERTLPYNEKMNKFIKITTYLRAVWKDVVFVEGTDKEYIQQITDYYEFAEHDDAPDSLASLIREMFGKRPDTERYKSIMERI